MDSDFDFAAPLSGQAEAALSDLIFGNEDKLALIEFKRNRNALQSEAKKFIEPLEYVAAALEDKRGCHYFVYGNEVNSELALEGCHYFSRESIAPSEILANGVDLDEFKSYCESLMPYRAPDKRCNGVFSFSGLEQVVGVSPNGVKAVTLSEFLAIHHPELIPAQRPAPRGPKF